MPTPRSTHTRARILLLTAGLIAALMAAYAGSLRGAFLWDDDLHITANPTIIGPLGLKEIWTSAQANYFPLVLTNFWIQHTLWELNPLGYRMVTFAFHVAAALLLWRVLTQLRMPGAWLGAALWALHPVQVESAAWICELKNTQSAVFFLAGVSFWLRWLGRTRAAAAGVGQVQWEFNAGGRGAFRTGDYMLALGCAVLAILSKPSTVMLPVALGLCTWWVRRRLTWRDGVPLLPFFALSAVAAAWTIWEQKYHSGALGPEWDLSWPERTAIAGRVIWFYLGKLIWPDPLVFIYPRWDIAAGGPVAYLGLIATVVMGAVLVRAVARGRWQAIGFVAAYFAALLFPVLGFFNVYFFRYSFVGDHFQYLASMGPLALLGHATVRFGGRFTAVMAVALLGALGGLTAKHARNFVHNERLWRDTVSKNPGAIMAWLNLADTLSQAERHEEAIATYRHALRLRPDDPYALNDLGCALTLIGRAGEAVPLLERSLAVKPGHAEAHNNLGHALRALGRSQAAIVEYRRALELRPDYSAALNNLGAELAETGKPAEALEVFEQARRLKANDAATLDNMGSALRVLGRYDEAITRHTEALRVRPDFPEAHVNLGRTLVAHGRVTEALPLFERALQLRPSLPGIHGHYASALAAMSRPDDALAQLRRGVEVAPRSAQAHLNLGTALAQRGRISDAVTHFETAVQLAPDFTGAHLNLGNALAATKRWTEAAAAFGRAVTLDPNAATPRVQYAVALVNSDQLEAAVPQFEAALQLQPTAEVHLQLAQVLRALGRSREALEQFERAGQLPRGR